VGRATRVPRATPNFDREPDLGQDLAHRGDAALAATSMLGDACIGRRAMPTSRTVCELGASRRDPGNQPGAEMVPAPHFGAGDAAAPRGDVAEPTRSRCPHRHSGGDMTSVDDPQPAPGTELRAAHARAKLARCSSASYLADVTVL